MEGKSFELPALPWAWGEGWELPCSEASGLSGQCSPSKWDLLFFCRVILESDPQQVVHRVALRVSKSVPLKPQPLPIHSPTVTNGPGSKTVHSRFHPIKFHCPKEGICL